MDGHRPGKTHSVTNKRTKSVKAKIYGKRSCKFCEKYPCFDGIDNLETDFAKEGCRGYVQRKLNK